MILRHPRMPLSAFDDAAMLCFQESEWNDGSGASSLVTFP